MHVVILGGGLGGMAVLTTLVKTWRELESELKITLVDPKSYVEVRWASIRGMFDTSMAEAITVGYSKIMSAFSSDLVTHVTARAEAVDPSARTITLDNGERLTYDACLVTVGSVTGADILTPQLSPAASAEDETESLKGRRDDLSEYGEKLTNANSVLVIGGGLIGCEVAGDIAGFVEKKGKSTATDCRITLVHSGKDLAPGYGPKASQLVKKQLENRSIDIRLNVKAYESQSDPTVYELKPNDPSDETENEEIQADIVFLANGVTPSTPNLFPGVDNVTDENGWLLPDEYGRLENCDGRVFALGDCIHGEPKNGVMTMNQKKNIASNIIKTLKAAANNDNTNDVKNLVNTKVTGFIPGLITTGPDSGVAAMSFGTTSWILPYLKNKTMFVFKAKGEIGW